MITFIGFDASVFSGASLFETFCTMTVLIRFLPSRMNLQIHKAVITAKKFPHSGYIHRASLQCESFYVQER